MAHTIEDLYPLIRLEAPGLPEPVLQQEVQDALDNFLADSEAWKYSVPGLLDWTTAADFPTLTPGTEIPLGTRVVRYDLVKYASDGTNLKVVPFKSRQQLDREYPDWEVRTGTNPVAWTMNGVFEPRIIPTAAANVLSSLVVRVVLGTDRAAASIPEFILHEFGDFVQWGVLAKVLMLPGKDWTNQAAAAMYKVKYNDAVMKAKSRAQADYGQPDRTMSYGGIGGSVNVGYDDYGQ